MVVIPGEEGNMGILPGHAPVISTLRPGTIAVFQNGAVVERIFVAGGFAEVPPPGRTAMAEEAVPVLGTDRGVVARQIRDLKDAQIGSARAATPVHHAPLVCRLPIANKHITP